MQSDRHGSVRGDEPFMGGADNNVQGWGELPRSGGNAPADRDWRPSPRTVYLLRCALLQRQGRWAVRLRLGFVA